MNKIREKFVRMADKALPLTIHWSRERIVEFLCKQHEQGNAEATDLLYLQLHDDVRCKLVVERVDFQSQEGNDLIKQMIRSFVGYPKSVVAMMLRDVDTGDVEFGEPFIGGLLPEEKKDEDIPF